MNVKEFDELTQKVKTENPRWFGLESDCVPTVEDIEFSELEPCSIPGGYCKRFLQTVFPQADVTYSFEYGLTQESRRAGVTH